MEEFFQVKFFLVWSLSVFYFTFARQGCAVPFLTFFQPLGDLIPHPVYAVPPGGLFLPEGTQNPRILLLPLEVTLPRVSAAPAVDCAVTAERTELVI